MKKQSGLKNPRNAYLCYVCRKRKKKAKPLTFDAWLKYRESVAKTIDGRPIGHYMANPRAKVPKLTKQLLYERKLNRERQARFKAKQKRLAKAKKRA